MRAYAATIDITPDRPLDQGAGASAKDVQVRGTPPEPLEANVLAIWPDEDSAPILMVTLDLLYPGPALRAAVERAARPLAPERILMAASHTHRAPMTDTSKPGLGAVDQRYLRWLEGELTGLVSEALNPLTSVPATVRAGEGAADHSINRRLRRRVTVGRDGVHLNTVRLAPNRRGITDETLMVATVQDSEGQPIAHLWNYACHPVSHPDRYGYSGHYVSVVRDALRQRADQSDLPVLFFQGFSGDTRPSAAVGIRSILDLVRRIVNGPSFQGQMLMDDYRRWTDSLADRVQAVSDAAHFLESTPVETTRLIVPGNKFAIGLPYPVTFQRLSFGEELVLLAVSAEVVAEYASTVRELSPAALTMCIGCVDHPYGYLPTRQMVQEGGYEADGFCAPFGIERVLPQIEEVTRAALASLFAVRSREEG